MSTKASISKNLSRELNLSSNTSKKLVDIFLNTIIQKSNKKTIKISNFGSFSMNITPQRLGRNPKTKESYIICSRKKLTFSASKKIKEVLN